MNKPDDRIWRELVSRAAMLLLAAMFLAGGGVLLYAAWVAMRSSGGFVTLGLAVMGCCVAFPGLFFLKRAVLPSRVDETPPQFRTGEGAAGGGASWWAYLLDLF